MRALVAAITLTALASCTTAPPALQLQPLPPADIAHADYANPSLWLCRPGLADDKCLCNRSALTTAVCHAACA